ncbi:MAG: putative membrane protein YgcG [Verrucomicrobiales bacterium]|jgi:uncharacterized membrane protein YgcG
MSLEKVNRLFGVVPRIVEGISDDAGILNDSSKKRIRGAANELTIRFPQTNFSVVTTNLPTDTSLGVFAFWIFNEAGIARDLDRANNNHDILLTIDPSNGRCSLMVGYGLEPYVSEQQLGQIVLTARAALEARQFANAIGKIISNLSGTLTQIATNLEETHGVAPSVSAKSTVVETSPNDF